MSIKINVYLTILLSLCLAFVSCTQSEGPTGPQGEQGPQGPQGEQGTPGEDGEDGTANVIYSEWLDIVWNSTDTALLKTMRIDESRITEDLILNGIVLMYIKSEVSGTIVTVQLPYVEGNDFLYFRTGLQDSPEFAGLVLYLDSIDDSTPVSEGFEGLQIRYFLIPGGVPAKIPTSFFEDYNSVTEYYGIPD